MHGCAEGGNNARAGPAWSKCPGSHKMIRHRSTDMKAGKCCAPLKSLLPTERVLLQFMQWEYLLGCPREWEVADHKQDSPPHPLQHVFIQKAQRWERYDHSINRQGANSSKGKQLFKIKDKAGYCTNGMSWSYEKAETTRIHSQSMAEPPLQECQGQKHTIPSTQSCN